MKKLIALSLSLVASSMLANDVLKMAKDAGLEPLPEGIKELNIALEKIGIKPAEVTDAKIELGKMLYFEPRLSKSGIISCNTCHNIGLGGVDGIPASTGHK